MQRAVSNSLHLQERTACIHSTDGVSLGARVRTGTDLRRRATVFVVAHPYGPLGGSLDNSVVEALFANAASLGYSTCRFNFRGSGDSTGRTSLRGTGEVDDVKAVCSHLTSAHADGLDPPASKIVLCGYSYGSVATATAASEIPQTVAIISISYPSAVLWTLTFGNQGKHLNTLRLLSPNILKLFVSGSKDNFTSEANFMQFTSSIPDPKTVIMVKGADHFWAGLENQLIGHVNQWISKHLRPHIQEIGSINNLSSSPSISGLDSATVSPSRTQAPLRSSPLSNDSLTTSSPIACDVENADTRAPKPTPHSRPMRTNPRMSTDNLRKT